MKNFLLITFICMLIGSAISAKAPTVLWTKYYGGVESERTYNISETSDGGFISCGQSNSFSKIFNSWLIRMDANGDTLWTRLIGDTALPEQVKSMEETRDGGYIVCGGRMATDYKLHPFLMKLNSDGDLEWRKIISFSKITETGIWAYQTQDNGYIVAARIQSSVDGGLGLGIFKTDDKGNVTDSAIFNWEYYDLIESISMTHDGGYVIAGTTNSFASSTEYDDMFLMKINGNLDSLWLKLYATNDSLSERLGYVTRTSDDGFILVGAQGQYPGALNAHDVLIVKTDKDGKEVWKKLYGGSMHEVGFYAVELPNNDFIICGTGTSKKVSGGFDAYVLHINSAGDTIWTKFYGTPGIDELLCIKPVKAGGYILAGTTYYYSANPNKQDIYFIRLAEDITDVENHFDVMNFQLKQNFPNPFKQSTLINYFLLVPDRVIIDIYNSLGSKITTLVDEYQETGSHSAIFEADNLYQGLYYYTIQIGERIESSKMLLIK
jgi:hypothetical protein